MSSIVDFMKAMTNQGVAGNVSRPTGLGRSASGASEITDMVRRNGMTVGQSIQPAQAMQQQQATISTPQEYWLALGQGKTSQDDELEKLLGIGSQNALTAYLPFLGLK